MPLSPITAALNEARKHRDAGGNQFTPRAAALSIGHVRHAKGAVPPVHVGPIRSPVAGRTDHLPIHVPSGSYVIPADIISAMGEGNTEAGFSVAKNIFSQPFYGETGAGTGEPYDEATEPYDQSERPYNKGETPYDQPFPGRAAGGEVEGGVPIVAAGGEYVIDVPDIVRLGHGSLDDGHKTLDQFVLQMRAKTVKTLKNLPGPKTS